MDAQQFIESGILETYAMGLASAEEAKLVADMVARHPEVKAELEAIEVSMENFDQRNAVEPPVHLKEQILSKVLSSKFPVQGSETGNKAGKVVSIAPEKQSNAFKYAAAVALILFIGTAYYSYTLSSKLADARSEIEELNYANFLKSGTITNRDSAVNELKRQVALLSTPGMKSIELKGMPEVAPDAKAMAYANTTTGEVYLEIMNLPAAPEGMQYQFWGIVDGTPVTAGMIPLSDTTGIHPMTTVPNAVAYAISLEPKGGSQAPTGKIYVMGNS